MSPFSLHLHNHHVCMVLERLGQNHTYVKLKKYKSDKDTVECMGYLIMPEGLTMDPHKVAAISDWASSKDVHGVQQFLGFASFYRRVSNLVAPIMIPLQKGDQFTRCTVAQSASDWLKTMFTSASILIHPDPTKPFRIEAEASNFAIGSVLSIMRAPTTNSTPETFILGS